MRTIHPQSTRGRLVGPWALAVFDQYDQFMYVSSWAISEDTLKKSLRYLLRQGKFKGRNLKVLLAPFQVVDRPVPATPQKP